ncbi:hypothetical protein WICPIJ_005029 [Wickerhamomyces pijperi]|uniref:Uncharacterized protein n=1 Tax=Wickerhamomyces pijperi TaxID=599730 RepID=A0A9P8TMR1_WICPI|nr:hypothetical protein WICPIJ_005029 [Wickerhamomyces pijperi]
MASNTFTIEHIRESHVWFHIRFMNSFLGVDFVLFNNEFTNLNLCVGDGTSTDSCVTCSLQLFVKDVFTPSIPIRDINILHARFLADIVIVVTNSWFGD